MSERSIFLAALDIADPPKREAYLDQVCGSDDALRKHIEELIAAEAKLGGFLARPHAAVEVTEDLAPTSERPGTVIGPYKLMEQIGEGGFGLVFVAEQQHPVRRKVALKVIKPGMDSREVIARFEAERQALALMDHPHIAKVLDAGTTDSGRPYFAMELVRGVPITEYCDANHLTPRLRLELFVAVCQAVQHAHQKGVIHRDLKPTNILVAPHDGVPVVKVIDFGVAKALGQQLTDKTIYTRFAQMIGTPLYMSPEQAEINALDVDTRSDVYALGVLLYELLTGTTPFDKKRLASAAFDEIRRIIREEEPAKPSTRVHTMGATAATISAQRKTEPHKLSQLLRNELDWIVMKALEKDRTRRYDSASAFAADVGRYLRDEQVTACPPSLSYRMSKFARRNKAPLTVAAGFLVLLIAGVAASAWQAVRATKAEREAAASEQRAVANEQSARQSEQIAKKDRDAATQAQQSAVQEKNNALAAREELRHTLYASEMNLLQGAWEGRQYSRAAQFLDQQRPAAGQSDLRGFEWHYWHRRLQHGRLSSVEVPQLATKDFFRSKTLNFSRGGARLAAIIDYPGDSSTIQGFGLLAIFDGATGRELVTPLDPFPGWRDPAYSERLFSMSKDWTRLAVALAARGGRLESTQKQDDRISIRDGGTGNEIHSLESPGLIYEIALTPDGRRLAVGYAERGTTLAQELGVKVWDTATGDLVQTLPMLPIRLPAILWSPDGTRLLRQSSSNESIDSTSGIRQLFQIVDVASGEELWRREISSIGTYLSPWSWSPDGKLLVVAQARAGAAKPNVQLWDSDTETTLAILDREFESSLRDATIDFSPDGQRLAVVAGTNEIYVWDVPKLPLAAGAGPLRIAAPNLTLQTGGEEIRGLAFSADSRTLKSVVGTSIIAWDATAREDTGTGSDSITSGSTGASSRFKSIEISTDATKIAFGGFGLGQDFGVWDLTGNRELWRLKTEGPSEGRPAKYAFSPDGRRLALFQNAGAPQQAEWQLVIHDTQTGQELQRIPVDKPAASIYGVPLFRPDGGQVAAMIISGPLADRAPTGPLAAVAPRRLMAWDLATQKTVFSVNLYLNPSERKVENLLGYSPDGGSLAVGNYYDTSNQREAGVVFYDAATGEVQLQRSIPVPSPLRPWWIDFSGQTIGAVGSRDTVSGMVTSAVGRADVVLLDLATGQERLRLRGHDGFDQFAVSPDGSRLALGKRPPLTRRESELSIWSLKSGRRLLTLKRQGSVEALSFSPDGNRLVGVFRPSGFGDGAIKPIQIWDATPLAEEVAK